MLRSSILFAMAQAVHYGTEVFPSKMWLSVAVRSVEHREMRGSRRVCDEELILEGSFTVRVRVCVTVSVSVSKNQNNF